LALTISVKAMPQPQERAISRKGRFVTPAMGAIHTRLPTAADPILRISGMLIWCGIRENRTGQVAPPPRDPPVC
jgi:hypothetical protein